MSGVWAVTMVRDEADIIGPVIEHLLGEGVAGVIVADNLSTDGTRAIIDSLAEVDARVSVVDDSDPAYWQSQKMTALAHQAGERGAEWIIPFDADEVWYSPLGPLGEVLPNTSADLLLAEVLEHVPTPGDDPAESNPLVRLSHRRPGPKPSRKVCFRYDPSVRIWTGNHMVDRGGSMGDRGVVMVREYQYRSLEQTTRKVRTGRAALNLTNLAPSEGAHWRSMGAMSDAEIADWWEAHRAGPAVTDPCPLS